MNAMARRRRIASFALGAAAVLTALDRIAKRRNNEQ